MNGSSLLRSARIGLAALAASMYIAEPTARAIEFNDKMGYCSEFKNEMFCGYNASYNGTPTAAALKLRDGRFVWEQIADIYGATVTLVEIVADDGSAKKKVESESATLLTSYNDFEKFWTNNVAPLTLKRHNEIEGMTIVEFIKYKRLNKITSFSAVAVAGSEAARYLQSNAEKTIDELAKHGTK